MSLLPALIEQLEDLESFRRPLELFDQNFGLGFMRDDILSPVCYHRRYSPYSTAHYLRPWRSGHRKQSGVSHLSSNKDGFKVNLDVQQFKPDEISVKVVDDHVVIEGKHEERQDEHGYVQRQFTRRYALPKSVDPDTVTSQLSSDGVLMVSAPKKVQLKNCKERAVPITHTDVPAVQEKSKDKEEERMEQ